MNLAVILSGAAVSLLLDRRHHDGPEQIAPLQDTLMQLSHSLISEVHLVPHGRAVHFGTSQTSGDVRLESA